jgi:hypothetical protein
MTVLRQRFAMHMRLAKGGYAYVSDILDGESIVGCKVERRESRSGPLQVSYQLGQLCFDTARDFVEAYEAQQAAARASA